MTDPRLSGLKAAVLSEKGSWWEENEKQRMQYTDADDDSTAKNGKILKNGKNPGKKWEEKMKMG